MKRFFDIIVSSLLLLILSPILLLIYIVAKRKLGSPVFFVQQRPGQHGKAFKLIKFRSMREGKTKSGIDLPDAERMTKFGNALRNTSLDELPELWNVIKGEMSLVGPRPLLMEYLPLYSAQQRHRHDVKPGITGWAQINGRNAINWDEKFRLDLWYVEHQSLWLDIKILVLTVFEIFRSEGISSNGHVTMEKFNGN